MDRHAFTPMSPEDAEMAHHVNLAINTLHDDTIFREKLMTLVDQTGKCDISLTMTLNPGNEERGIPPFPVITLCACRTPPHDVWKHTFSFFGTL